MAHYDYRAIEFFDGLLEDVLRGHVEVVGRLVEDKEVDRFEEEAYHGETCLFAA